jgi:hypothetical protein
MVNAYKPYRDQTRRDANRPKRGKLGYFVAGQMRVVSVSNPAMYYVRFPDGTGSQFLHKNRVRAKVGTNVNVGWDQDNDYCILGLEPERAGAEMGNDDDVILPAHTHTAADITDLDATTVPYTATDIPDWTDAPIGGEPLHVGQGLDFLAETVRHLLGTKVVAGSDVSLAYNSGTGELTISVSGLTPGDITGLNESIDDRVAALLVAGSNITLTYDDTANTLTIASTGGGGGLTAEDVDDRVAALLVAGTGIGLAYDDALNTLTVTNTITTITGEDVDDRVAGLLVAGSNITLTYNDTANTLTIAVTGLTSAAISDFTEAAQDAIAALLVAGTGITLTYNDAGNQLTIAAAITPGLITGFDESAQDAVAAALAAGTHANITVTYNDAGNALSLAVSGLTSANISDFNEAAQDTAAAMMTAGTGIVITYNDVANTLTISANITSSDVSGLVEAVQDIMGAILSDAGDLDWTYNDAGNALSATVTGVGGSTAALIHTAELLANAATPNKVNDTIAKRDDASNFAVNMVEQAVIETTVATGGTTNFTRFQPPYARLIGSGGVGTAVRLPDATTVRLGHWYFFINRTTSPAGVVSIQDNAGTQIGNALDPGQWGFYHCRDIMSAAGEWMMYGSSQTEPLTNKTLDGTKNTFLNIPGSAVDGTSLPTPSTIMKRDANGGVQANAFDDGLLSVTAAGGTTVLTAASPRNVQVNAGTGAQTIQLPDATTLNLGTKFYIRNRVASVTVTVNKADGVQQNVLTTSASDIFMLVDNSTVGGQYIRIGNSGSEIRLNNRIGSGSGYLITNNTTSGTPLVLTALSNPFQRFQGSAAQVVQLPDATTLPSTGVWYRFFNDSTGIITVQVNSGAVLYTVQPGQWIDITNRSISTTDGLWAAGGSATDGTSLPTPNTLVRRDANGAAQATAFDSGAQRVAATGGTTVLTAASPRAFQLITGTTTHIAQLPDATTCNLGTTFFFRVSATGAQLTVNLSTGSLVAYVRNSSSLCVTLVDNSTAAGTWIQWGAAGNEVHTNNRLDFGSAYVLDQITTSSTPLVLTNQSRPVQRFSGTVDQIIQLPDATTLVATGVFWIITNDSTGILTVRLNDGTTVLTTVLPGRWVEIFVVNIGTTNGSWTMVSALPETVLGPLSTDTAPDETVDLGFTYDTSASLYKKVLLAKMKAARTSNYDVSATPTDFDFGLAFGLVPEGFHAVLQDNTVGTTYWCTFINSHWKYVAMSVATVALLADLLPTLSGFRYHWFAKDGDDNLMRATNPAYTYGKNTCPNSDFSTTAFWTLDTGWAITGGQLVATGALSSTNINVAAGLTLGKWYEITYDLVVTSGSVRARAGSSGNGTTRTVSGTYTEIIQCAGNTNFAFNPVATFTGTIDNATIRQVNIRPSTDYPAGTGRLNVATNGQFEFSYAWTLGAGWAIVSGVLRGTATSATASEVAALIQGKSYDVTYTITNFAAGSVRVVAGGTNGTLRTANGTYVETLVAGASGTINFASTGFTGDIDNLTAVPTDSLLLLAPALAASWAAIVAAPVITNPSAGVVQIASSSASNPEAMQQFATVAGRKYVFFVEYQTDGVVSGRIRNDTTNLITSLAATTWTALVIPFTANGTSLRIGNVGTSAAGQFVQWRNMLLVEVNPLDGNVTAAVRTSGQPAGIGGYSYKGNGSSSFINFLGSEVNAIRDFDEGIFGVILKIDSWAAGSLQRQWVFQLDGSNRFLIDQPSALANTLNISRYGQSSTPAQIQVTGLTATGYLMIHMRYSVVGNYFEVYINGVLVGSVTTGIVTAVGNMNAAIALAATVTPGNVSDDYVAAIYHFNDPKDAAFAAAIAQVAGLGVV